MDVSVKPGDVVASRKCADPDESTRMSIRAISRRLSNRNVARDRSTG